MDWSIDLEINNIFSLLRKNNRELGNARKYDYEKVSGWNCDSLKN
jgi:hypothetical protein